MTLKTLTVTGPILESDVLKFVVDDDYCKEQETLAAGSGADNVAKIGTVLGRLKAATVAVAAPAFTGTGNGVLTRANPAYGVGVQAGTYKVRLIEAGADAGSFEVLRPDGTVDGIAEVGVAYTGQVKFTIADGATDFSAAAQFTLAVTVSAVSWKYWPLDLTAVNGIQNAAAVSLSQRTATDGGTDLKIVLLKRGPAIVDELHLIWPAGATDEQKATGLAQLEALGIVAHAS
jgi:head decoration protein D